MIKIICVGKIKEKYLDDAIKEYEKRLSKYTKLEIIVLPDYDYDNEILTKEKEKELILKNINPKDYIITLEIEGNMLTSKDFALKMDNIYLSNSNITLMFPLITL